MPILNAPASGEISTVHSKAAVASESDRARGAFRIGMVGRSC